LHHLSGREPHFQHRADEEDAVKSTRTLIAALALGSFALAGTPAFAADVLLQKNGFADLFGGQITGTGGYFMSLGTTATDVNLTGLTAPGTYGVDFFHNAGANDSNFTFSIDGAGNVTSITTNGNGAGSYTVATGVGTQTLSLNTHPFTYNANGGQTGQYYIQGLINSQVGGSASFNVIPGIAVVDNLYNTGAGNEDFTFAVDSDGNAAIPIGNSGPVSHPIPWGEYATVNTDGQIDVNHKIAHFVIEASAPIAFVYHQALSNFTAVGNTYEFDLDLTIGNGGINIYSFGTHTITGGNAIRPDGTLYLGGGSTNDYLFYPQLRYDGTEYYFENGDDAGNKATGQAVGFFDGDTNPLTVNVTAYLPEPASALLVLAGGAMALIRRR
jgi:hypothetical protein